MEIHAEPAADGASLSDHDSVVKVLVFRAQHHFMGVMQNGKLSSRKASADSAMIVHAITY